VVLQDAQPLREVVAQIAVAPQSAVAPTSYALVSTLEHESAGRLFKLGKLRNLTFDQRQLACRLI